MSFWSLLNTIFSVVIFFLMFYQIIYIIIGLFFKKKFKDTSVESSYGILIAGRNEENVIKQLIDSIKRQHYNQDKIKIFVCADNCSPNDKTAQYAREMGAIVYERHNKNQIGKSYALDFLLKNIARDFPDYSPDGWFVFDADNLLDLNYIKEMNKAFNSGHEIVTSYRASKNFGTSLMSMGSSIHFIRECRFIHNPRALLNLSTNISGTGFLVSSKILNPQNGWKYRSITEDLEFSCDSLKGNHKITYCDDAIFYDEQPETWSQTYKQRLRWQKGSYQVSLAFSFSFILKFLSTFKFPFFDLLIYFAPIPVISTTWAFCGGVISFIKTIIKILMGSSVIVELSYFILTLIIYFITLYLGLFLYGSLAVIKDWDRIKATKKEKILSMLAYPIFMVTLIPITYIALFKEVEWVPIKHQSTKKIEDLETISKQ